MRAGDVLGSGTCGNGGCLAELWGVRGEQEPPELAAELQESYGQVRGLVDNAGIT
ncbi:hypothetical protein GCM10010255_11360 [Streptomyces coeruleofuscus]|uniref:Uncharacterized protein n=1 Tax=Streptomyces coeruleofuscus TaxID=66879 RepID=A0ABP5URX9_9ACTN